MTVALVVGMLRKSLRRTSTMGMAFRLAASVVLLAGAVLFALGCGEGIRESLPGSYHDSQPRVYAVVGVLYGLLSAGFAIAALHAISSLFILGSDWTPRASGWLAALLTPVAALPFDRILDSESALAMNLLFGAAALGLGFHSVVGNLHLDERRPSLKR